MLLSASVFAIHNLLWHFSSSANKTECWANSISQSVCTVDHVTKKRVGEDVRHIHTHTYKGKGKQIPLNHILHIQNQNQYVNNYKLFSNRVLKALSQTDHLNQIINPLTPNKLCKHLSCKYVGLHNNKRQTEGFELIIHLLHFAKRFPLVATYW